MPPALKLKNVILSGLVEELRYTSKGAARRQVERAEALADVVTPEGTYPEDWVVYQVTGLRPDGGGEGLIGGADLLHDLSALVQRLSQPALYDAAELASQGWLTAADLGERWKVTARTLQRYQRLGLLSRRAKAKVRGSWAVMFKPSAVEKFEGTHAVELKEAGAFSRMSEEERARVRAVARRGARMFGWSLAHAAARLAQRTGRSIVTLREAIEGMHEADAGAKRGRGKAAARASSARVLPILAARKSMGQREQRLIERATRRGVSSGEIGERLGKSESAVIRAWLTATARRLRRLELWVPESAEYTPKELRREARTASVLLGAPGVNAGLGSACAADLREHVRATLEAGWPDVELERARARALGYLLVRARATVAELARARPAATKIDEAMTDLLWAARLKAELVRSQQMSLLKTVEGRLGRSIIDLPAKAASELFVLCIGAVSSAADRYDAGKGGRLAAPAGIEVNRVMARWESTTGALIRAEEQAAARRATRASPEVIPVADWTRRVYSWQWIVEPPESVRQCVVRQPLGADAPAWAGLLRKRFGLASDPPRTVAELAVELHLPENLASRQVREAVRRARREWHGVARHDREKREG